MAGRYWRDKWAAPLYATGAEFLFCEKAWEQGEMVSPKDAGAYDVPTFFRHARAILDDDTLKCRGKNSNIGYGGGSGYTTAPKTTAVNLGSGRTAKSVSLKWVHTCVILDDDTVKCWGTGSSGQLGYGNNNNLYSPPSSTVNLGMGVTSISAGAYTSCAILTNGGVKCWGSNGYGQIGDGTTTARNSPADVDLGTGLTAKMVYVGYYSPPL